VVLIASEDVLFLGRFFSTSGHILGLGLNEVGLLVEMHNSRFPNAKSYLDTHMIDVHVVLIVSEDV
jgi:hypothetical protein